MSFYYPEHKIERVPGVQVPKNYRHWPVNRTEAHNAHALRRPLLQFHYTWLLDASIFTTASNQADPMLRVVSEIELASPKSACGSNLTTCEPNHLSAFLLLSVFLQLRDCAPEVRLQLVHCQVHLRKAPSLSLCCCWRRRRRGRPSWACDLFLSLQVRSTTGRPCICRIRYFCPRANGKAPKRFHKFDDCVAQTGLSRVSACSKSNIEQH